MRKLRGDVMSMIFQDPLSSMHPFYRVGDQIREAYLVHNHVGTKRARRRPWTCSGAWAYRIRKARYRDYPHQFSGGMRQRAMIAMALICNPKLLIADEPTTALDVTVQAQILELIKDLQREYNSAVILITHDLGVVAETCRAGARHVRRSVCGDGHGRGDLLPPRDALYLGIARLDAADGSQATGATPADPGPATVADQGANRAASSTRGAPSDHVPGNACTGGSTGSRGRGRQSPGAVSHRLG